MKTNKSIGSSFDDFLKEEGIYEDVEIMALKRVIVWKIEQQMKKLHIQKAELARRMHTSRTQVDRLLDPTNVSVTLSTLAKASKTVGGKLQLDMVTPAVAA